jgi:Cu(I)/Ag(I) efflux system membrane fusion protein
MALNRRTFLAGLAVAGTGAALAGYGVARHDARGTPQSSSGTVWTCSMHPQIRQDHAGTCPICNMNLTKADGPTAPASHEQGHDMVHVPPTAQRAAGIATAVAADTRLAQTVRAYAAIGVDASAAVSVNPKVEGWIRRLAVAGVGQPVRRGQLLYEIYSPELQQRQREYIELLTRKDALLADASMSIPGANAAMAGSLAKEKFRNRARLLAADMSEELVAALEKSRRIADVVPVHAAHDGIVTAIGVQEGSYVNPMQQVLAYADTRRIWAELTLYPDQLRWLKTGDTVHLRSALDGSETPARLDLATLQVDAASRTARLRLPVHDARGKFPPGAFAEARIEAAAQAVLAVPRDAVVRSGTGDYVIVADAHDHFRRVRVATGIENDTSVAITHGLRAGDRVAVQAQFLLDGAIALQDGGQPERL